LIHTHIININIIIFLGEIPFFLVKSHFFWVKSQFFWVKSPSFGCFKHEKSARAPQHFIIHRTAQGGDGGHSGSSGTSERIQGLWGK